MSTPTRPSSGSGSGSGSDWGTGSVGAPLPTPAPTPAPTPTARGIWHVVSLTPSHRPVLLSEDAGIEVEMGMYEGIRIERDGASPSYGTLIITTHRLIWLAPNEPAVGLWCKDIHRVEQKSGFLSSRVTIHTNVQPFPSSYRVHMASHKQEAPMINTIQQALAQQQWTKVSTPALPVEKRNFTTSAAGINGIIRSVHDSSRKTDRTLDQAFSDLNALMQNASEIVSLASRFAAHSASSSSLASSSDEAEFSSLLVSMGIASPVTKRIAGSQYHEQLARQLADWVQPQLESNGGLLSLPDVYCLFNRARGTELISPDDLLLACNQLTSLGLGMRLRKFDSGVIVLECLAASCSSSLGISARILSCISTHGPLSALRVSSLLSISLVVAQQYLHECEYAGHLCRDESVEGVTYYHNFFT